MTRPSRILKINPTNGDIIQVYETAKVAELYTGYSASYIRSCCRYELPLNEDFEFRYEKDYRE